MIVNRAGLDSAAAGFRALFTESLLGAPKGFWQSACFKVDSDGAGETYNWMAELPAVREFLDERAVQRLRAEAFTLANRDWEDTVIVHKNELRDDKLGVVRPRIQGLAEAMVRHRDSLFWGTIVAGTGVAGYDGANFFSAAHPRDGALANQSNTGASALTQANFNTAIAQVMALTDRVGEPLDLVPTHLISGLAYRDEALEICKASFISDSAGGGDSTTKSNINEGFVEPVISSRLTGNRWGLLCLDRSVKPFVFQIREEPEFEAMDTGERAFMRKEFLYGASASHACAGALWPLAYLNTGP